MVRNLTRQVQLTRMLKESNVSIMPLTAADAVEIGRMLARAGTSDVVDAHVVLCAERQGYTIVTTDPDDISRLGSVARVVAV